MTPKPSPWRWLGAPDPRTLALFALAVAFLVNSMALYEERRCPAVVVYDPRANLARWVRANRGEDSLRDLYLGGFRAAAALATGSHPYEIARAGRTDADPRVLGQLFAPEAARAAQRFRETIAVHRTYGSIELSFHSPQRDDVKILPRGGAFFFETHFNQTIPFEDKNRVRTFHVMALGQPAPATLDNPYGVKFAEFRVFEVKPKTPRH